MNEQVLVIYNLPKLFDILNEIKENFNFSLINLDKDFKKENINFKNYVVVSSKKNIFFSKQRQLNINFPINFSDLISEINVGLLKQKYNSQSQINIGEYQINTNSRELIKNKDKLKLTEKEIEIVLFMNSSKNEVSIEKLKKEVWNYKTDLETHTVETHIYRLRKKIQKIFGNKEFIISNKNGYKIN